MIETRSKLLEPLVRHGGGLAAIGPLVAALCLFVIRETCADDVPPYPYPPPWVTALQEKLQATCTFEFKDTPLREALEKVSAVTGVSIRIAPEVREAGGKRITCSYKDRRAETVLYSLAADSGTRWIKTENGVVFTGRSNEQDPVYRAMEIGDSIERVRRIHFPTKEEKAKGKTERAQAKKIEDERTEAIEKLKSALRSTKVSRDFLDASFDDILRHIAKRVKETTKVVFVPTKAAEEKVKSEGRKLTIKGGFRSAETVLDELLRSHELKYKPMSDGVCLILLKSEPTLTTMFAVWGDEQRQAERKVFGTKLKEDLRGSRVCDVADALARDIGVKVFPDSRAWGTEVRLPAKTAGITVRRLAALLKSKGIELEVWDSPSCFQQRLFESPPSLPRVKPPGLADVDWSIYLLKRKQ